MNSRTKFQHRLMTTALTSCLTLVISACGSSDVINPGSGGTGTTDTSVVGPITGFGSVIVNGVRYDDSTAAITDDRGISLPRSELRLGMMVSLTGSASTSSATGRADNISVFSEIKGIVEAADANGFLINGLSVRVLPSTVFDGSSAVGDGDFVEVYGAYDRANNQIVATRIERKSIDDFKMRGIVSNWDSAASRFALGTLSIDYTGTTLPVGFDNGVSIRAYANAAPIGGIWTVSDIRLTSSSSSIGDGRAEIKGVVSNFVSLSDFRINDVPVDGSNAVIRDGSAADVLNGAWIEVEGSIQSGTLVASEIEIEDGSGSGSSSNDEFEVTGLITNFVSVAQFTVRNTRIDASQSPRFEDGDITGLANGVCVEIKGNLQSGANGTLVNATRVKFEDDCQ